MPPNMVRLRRLTTHLLCALFLLAACTQKSATLHPTASVLVPAKPRAALSEATGSVSSALLEPFGPSANPTKLYSYYIWDSVSCDAVWNQICSRGELINLTAPDGYQACNLIYTVASQFGNAKVLGVYPGSPFPGDDQSPPRYKTLSFNIQAIGSGDILNQTGASIHLANVGLTILFEKADNSVRKANGCRLAGAGGCSGSCCPTNGTCPTIPKAQCWANTDGTGVVCTGGPQGAPK
jgi:hypothetical protein